MPNATLRRVGLFGASRGTTLAHMNTGLYIAGVAANIAAAVRRSGITAIELERRTGISRHTLKRRLVRADSFTVQELALVSAALGTNVRDFFPVKDAA